MVADDILKRGLGKLAAYRPTHLILDFIDERFNLLRRGATVINHSWELHRAGYDAGGPAARLTRPPVPMRSHCRPARRWWLLMSPRRAR